MSYETIRCITPILVVRTEVGNNSVACSNIKAYAALANTLLTTISKVSSQEGMGTKKARIRLIPELKLKQINV